MEKTEKTGVDTLQWNINVRDSVHNKDREARLVDLNMDNSKVQIHHHGWKNKHDKWLQEDSDRIVNDANTSDSSDGELEDADPVISQQTK